MRDNTPPMSPYSLDQEEADDDELIYVGEADEVLEQLQNEMEDSDDSVNDGDDYGDYIPERDDALLTFEKHTAPVFCGSLHPTEDLAVTGGEDDKAYVWNTTSGAVKFEVPGHSDSVIGCEFSYDGTFLATGDIAGLIQVFKVTQDFKKVWEFTMGDMCWLKWHFGAHVLLAGADSGEIYVWRIPSGDCKVLQGFGEKCDVAKLTNDGKSLAAGYGNGAFKIWDLKTSTTSLDVAPSTSSGQVSNIISMSIDRDSQLIATGSEEGKVVLFRPTGFVAMLPVEWTSSVDAIVIDNPDFEIKVAATGTLNGKVTVWDLARQSPRVECENPTEAGIMRLLWGKDCTLIGGTLGGIIRVWDLRSGRLIYDLLGHRKDILDLSYDKARNLVLSTSEDGTAKIFKLQ
ncbi:angio-associated migratory cell protein isoform X2 [Sabethes cyaneus]|uniref:angio-associated migratory cell protein isoform X2 n=1 Tax=Sabethes cyaneus TaxID=53552 RepID=UPI00237D44CA|nr:angio-associated migratory cell protein isoform X2 [Sabethes cyaneus]